MAFKIYYASPLFNMAEVLFNQALANELKQLGNYDIYVPQDLEESRGYQFLVDENLRQLKMADIIIANCDGPIADDGTSYEIGRADERKIPIIALRTDLRGHEEEGFNLMFRNLHRVRVDRKAGIRALAHAIHKKITKVFAPL